MWDIKRLPAGIWYSFQKRIRTSILKLFWTNRFLKCVLSTTPLCIPHLGIGHKLSSCVDTELGIRSMVLSLLLYQVCCRGFGGSLLLIAQPNLDSCLDYEYSFSLEKEGSGGEEEKLLQTYCFAKTWGQGPTVMKSSQGSSMGTILLHTAYFGCCALHLLHALANLLSWQGFCD